MQNYINDVVNFLIMTQKGQFIVSSVASILVFISMCLMLEDNREKCWSQIIPFYGTYVKYRAFWDKKYFWFTFIPGVISLISFISSVVLGVSAYFNQQAGMAAQAVVVFIVSVAVYLISIAIVILFNIILTYNISKTYDYDGAFTVGLCFLPTIFYVILGIKCINKGVFKRIPTGRIVFMVIMVVLSVLLSVWFYQNFLNNAALMNNITNLPNYNIR